MVAVDPERLVVWRRLVVAHAAIERMLSRALLAERDLPLAWFEVLAALQAVRGRLRVMELAEVVMVNPSSLSRQLDRIEEAGLIRRERSGVDEDARAVTVVLTPEGRACWRAASVTYKRVVRKAFTRHLTDTDVTALSRVFTKVLEAE